MDGFGTASSSTSKLAKRSEACSILFKTISAQLRYPPNSQLNIKSNNSRTSGNEERFVVTQCHTTLRKHVRGKLLVNGPRPEVGTYHLLMALPMLVGGAECGPSTPLQGLSKAFHQDRGIQQVKFQKYPNFARVDPMISGFLWCWSKRFIQRRMYIASCLYSAMSILSRSFEHNQKLCLVIKIHLASLTVVLNPLSRPS